MQKFLTFLITIFIIFAIIKSKVFDISGLNIFDSGKGQQEEDKNQTVQQFQQEYLEGNFLEKSISKIISNVIKTPQGKKFFENLVQPMNKTIDGPEIMIGPKNDHVLKAALMITDILKEPGDEACCGENVSVAFKLHLPDKTTIEKEESFILGMSKVNSNFDTAIVGMTENSKRAFVLKPRHNNEDFKELTQSQVEVKLLKLNKAIDISKVRIFDDSFSYTVPSFCGDQVSFEFKVTKIDGMEIYKSSEITMKIGDSLNWPPLFSYVLFNKTLGGSRFVLAPAKYLEKLLVNNSFTNILPEEYLIIEFYNFQNLTLKDFQDKDNNKSNNAK